MEETLLALTAVVVLGIGSQWLAWRLGLPSILLLLLSGFLAGPVLGFLDPDHLFGFLLPPAVSLSVAIILFDGGLSLHLSELPEMGRVLRRLITLGAALTWLLGSSAAYWSFALPWPLAALLGAILVVTGPTVITPLLRQIRPTGPVGPLLRWEGILIDPIGATLAVLIFEAILAAEAAEATSLILLGVAKTALVGLGLGFLAAGILVYTLKKHWVPDFLENAVTLMLVLATYTVSDLIQSESGLLSVTVAGVVLANQTQVAVRHIIEFKENLRVLLLSGLFVLLAARLQWEQLQGLGGKALLFLLFLILLVRPLSVAVCSWGSSLSWRERLFVSWMAPRGIVAAAVSSIFSLQLVASGHPEAAQLVPLTFLVIVGTISVYGLTAPLLARLLQVARPDPQGVLFAGAEQWVREIALSLQKEGVRVLLVDSNWRRISAARLQGLPSSYASILSEYVVEETDLDGIGRLLAMTPNDEVNSLATLHFSKVFGRREVYQLAPEDAQERPRHRPAPLLFGRILFAPQASYRFLSSAFAAGAEIRVTPLTEEFRFQDLQAEGERRLPLFLIRGTRLLIFTADAALEPRPEDRLISLELKGEVPTRPASGA